MTATLPLSTSTAPIGLDLTGECAWAT